MEPEQTITLVWRTILEQFRRMLIERDANSRRGQGESIVGCCIVGKTLKSLQLIWKHTATDSSRNQHGKSSWYRPIVAARKFVVSPSNWALPVDWPTPILRTSLGGLISSIFSIDFPSSNEKLRERVKKKKKIKGTELVHLHSSIFSLIQ